MLVFFHTKRLPWHRAGLDMRNRKKEYSQIKLNSTPEEICTGDAIIFKDILEQIYEMKYEEEPDYARILFHFEKILLDDDIVSHSRNYDWIHNAQQQSNQSQ
jgi:hypothetical protein